MAHANISVFIPHMGCPHACSFCNQRTISDTAHAPTPDEAEEIIKGAYEHITDPQKRSQTEIAFFGGSFTAIDRDYMTGLLAAAKKYTGEKGFCGIRISTRPDCIDEEILMLLKSYNVTAIELGAQSMNDEVLRLNDRGHTASDVENASRLIKAHGFELGLQMMVGLYGSTQADELYTMRKIIALHPDTVRIYPVAVLAGTRLAELYKSGEYKLYPFEEAVRICGILYCAFTSCDIRVIRMGLHAEEGVGENMIAGFYHPAFGELVRSEIIKNVILKYYESQCKEGTCLEISANKSLIGAVRGHKRSNRIYFSEKGLDLNITEDNSLPSGTIRINEDMLNVFKIT